MDSNDQFAYLQQFTYSRGSTKIKVASNSHSTQDFCLDLGTVRGRDGTNLHLYECVDVPQQQFWITDAGDDHIALEGESYYSGLYGIRCPYQPLLTNGLPVTGDNQCIDVRAESGSTQESPYNSLKDVQSWQCSGGNPNQVRHVLNPL